MIKLQSQLVSHSLHDPCAKSSTVVHVRQTQIVFARPVVRPTDKATNAIKWGIWAYFLLLIFEGALRKWLLPEFSTPLLVVRDPIALVVLVMAYQRGLMPTSNYVKIAMSIGVVAFAAALVFGHGSLIVATYGARTLLVHFPFAFVMGRVLDRNDVLKMGRVTLWLTMPMVVLIGLQFYSPQSAWVNRGIGGDLDGAGFSGAMGYMRPTGTFSFTNGNALFFGLAGAFIAYFWLEPKKISRMVLLGSTAALLMSIPLSISRTLLFELVIITAFAFAVLSRQPKYLKQILGLVLAVAIALALLSTTTVFQHATEVLTARFENASKSEGGLRGTLIDRFLGGLAGAILSAEKQDLFGKGIGLGTNVGAKYTTGRLAFLIAEGEWGRTVGELGPLLGLSLIFMRIAMAFDFLTKGYHKLSNHDSLPWMLLSFGFLLILQEGWAQPTSLGFFTVITGVVLASLSGRSGAPDRQRPKPDLRFRERSQVDLLRQSSLVFGTQSV